MIIVKLRGGIGNQMFQYAFGRNISLKYNTELKLDTTEFSAYGKHTGYSLNIFNIDEKIATQEEINSAHNRYIETMNIFHEQPINMGDNTHFDGYFQSEKFFIDSKNIIVKDFIFKYPFTFPFSDYSEKLLKQIESSDSVGVHVRRGDYFEEEEIKKIFGVDLTNYYKSSIEHISNRVSDANFFIFSNDIDWCKKNLNYTPAIFVENNHPFNDFYLMVNCKHNIIANSTFSWWAAYLSKYNNDKIIIAPKQWFKSTLNDKDMVPDRWLRL